ncbi:amino acid transporter, partial [Francisella tularensis subsp. holarctica]|nr:amino acid transporter [Francisella tularensis subsp. holarctica]
AQLAVIAYILMCITAVKLKISSPIEEDQYDICKGSFGTILMALLGCFGCLVEIIVGFIPIENMSMSVFNFDMMLIVGIVIS